MMKSLQKAQIKIWNVSDESNKNTIGFVLY